MRQSSNRFDSYAGRGITVCARWQKFENFFTDMGERPIGMTLEREDNDGDYEPNNCRWATIKEQARNRRSSFIVEAYGKRASLAEHTEVHGVPYKRTWKRIRKYGWPPEQALTSSCR